MTKMLKNMKARRGIQRSMVLDCGRTLITIDDHPKVIDKVVLNDKSLMCINKYHLDELIVNTAKLTTSMISGYNAIVDYYNNEPTMSDTFIWCKKFYNNFTLMDFIQRYLDYAKAFVKSVNKIKSENTKETDLPNEICGDIERRIELINSILVKMYSFSNFALED